MAALQIAFVGKGTVTMSKWAEALRPEEQRLNPGSRSVGPSGSSVLVARGNIQSLGRGNQSGQANAN